MTNLIIVIGVAILAFFVSNGSTQPNTTGFPNFPSIPSSLELCGAYTGKVCANVIGSAQILTPSIITPVADAIIQQSVTLYQAYFGDDFTTQCRDLLVFTNCINFLSPCADRVWCSDLSVDELQQKVNESCRCTGGTFKTRLCEASIGGLFEQISNLTKYYETDQAPSNTTCEIVTLPKPKSGASSNTGVTLIGSLITTILVTIGVVML